MAKAKKTKTGILDQLRKAGGRNRHPHLLLVNGATLDRDCRTAIETTEGLLGYQRFLVDARSEKARRKTVSGAFERNVQAQARLAVSDLDGLCASALRATQQMNHAGLWTGTFKRLETVLKTDGPLDAKQMWAEITASAEHRAALRARGMTDAMQAAITEFADKADASLVWRGGQISVETGGSGRRARHLMLKASAGRPRNALDLLRRSQFEQALAAFAEGRQSYLEIVPAEGVAAYEPRDLFALGAVAARQRFSEHLRKLEDTGLATYAGNDPITILIGGMVAGLILCLVGYGILRTCQPDVDETICTIAEVMLYIGVILLTAAVLIGVGTPAVAGMMAVALAVDVLVFIPELIRNFDRMIPGFSAPASQPPPP